MNINKIFEKWIELTEVNPLNKKMVITSNNINIYDYNEEIKSAMETDISGGYDTAIIMQKCFTSYIDSLYFSANEIISNSKEYLNKINLIQEMKNLLYKEDILEYKQKLLENINEISDYYNISEHVKDLTDEEKIDICINSKKAIKYLSSVQFKKGEKSNKNPKLIKNIHMFSNLNEMILSLMNGNFDGISVNCIIDNTNMAYSYFCFTIKNGDNIYMISDKPQENNIARKFSGRAQGRDFYNRICKFLFPYELMNFNIDRYSVNIKSNALVENQQGKIIGNLSDCPKESSLWLVYCLGLLYNKYFVSELEEKEIVYTGAMINIPLLENTSTALRLKKEYESIDVKRLDIESVKVEELEYAEHHKRFHKNDWLVERYRDQIDEEILNLQGDIGKDNRLMVLDNNIIGTKEELENYRKWCARYNLSENIDNLYQKEVSDKFKELRIWYIEKIEEKIDYIKEIIAKEECVLTKYYYTNIKEDKLKDFYDGKVISHDDEIIFSRAFLNRKENCINKKDYEQEYSGGNYTRLMNLKNGYGKSYFEHKPISYCYTIEINNAKAIAEFLEMKVEELPELLQHYTRESHLYEGNQIIEQLDPMEYNISNHISEFPASIKIYVSKSELKNIIKEFGNKK